MKDFIPFLTIFIALVVVESYFNLSGLAIGFLAGSILLDVWNWASNEYYKKTIRT